MNVFTCVFAHASARTSAYTTDEQRGGGYGASIGCRGLCLQKGALFWKPSQAESACTTPKLRIQTPRWTVSCPQASADVGCLQDSLWLWGSFCCHGRPSSHTNCTTISAHALRCWTHLHDYVCTRSLMGHTCITLCALAPSWDAHSSSPELALS